jgi:hypothetical protein
LSAAAFNEGSAAGTDTLTAQVLPAATPITASSDQSWLTITGISNGVITFAFTANPSANSRTSHISVLGEQVPVTQSGDAPASIAIVAGNNQRTPAGQSFATNLQVQVTDASGQPVAGALVYFRVIPGMTGAGGTFASSPHMPISTDANGMATAPQLTANNTTGEFHVRGSTSGLIASFTLINTKP